MKIQGVISNVGITEKNGKQHVHIRSISLPFCSSGQSSVPNFEEKGSEKKMNAWYVSKSPCHRYFPVLTLFIVKKDFVK